MTTFNDLGLNDGVIKAISEMGFEETTPIQRQAIPQVMNGQDIIGQAQTGTGKTAAFGIPYIERIQDPNNKEIKGLVVTPTRELAIQVAEEINRLGQYNGITALPIYGGQSIGHQIKALKKRPQIIVGTPGRLIDHLNRKTIKLNNVNMVTLDEADEMLNMGFIEDIKTILQKTPSHKQTLMFSATMPGPIKSLAEQFMNDPEIIRTKTKEITVPSIEQQYVEVKEGDKFDVFCRLVDSQSPEKAIVFGRTKRRVDELYQALKKRGYFAEGIHGDMPQTKRDHVIKNFRTGATELLVATDVASRGLDVTGISHIYNFDIPQDADSYVHRIGRTGRAGQSGAAVTLVTPREKGHLNLIEQSIKRQIPRRPKPSVDEALEGKQKIAVEKLLSEAKDKNARQYHKLAEELLEENDSIELVAGALKSLTVESEGPNIKLTEEAPIVRGKSKSKKGSGKSGSGKRQGHKRSHKNYRKKGR
ncbi:DEAD/DEAH box helicase [Natranaerobius thermophilus]|uniref:ATP-dependent RNA helicase CshA n=1 Tax=Natranaerobius thermophilus (strain ATCC BAA-1301 / DSM 18059 / JW/NM-WN-LF) TaxID=457570 RepID=B2A8C1_NATTJ|nr:DEAD/DEAH box helicase [Natranaerobius thermophilus]ACB84487.1 DEAD/DEAH box helicase domain protein [Natranaerobius thermophilus JW/NM-WN-LF]